MQMSLDFVNGIFATHRDFSFLSSFLGSFALGKTFAADARN